MGEIEARRDNACIARQQIIHTREDQTMRQQCSLADFADKFRDRRKIKIRDHRLGIRNSRNNTNNTQTKYKNKNQT